MHLMLQFGSSKDDKIKEGDVEYVVGTKSYVKITKNKIGPKFNSIPCYIDVRKLGIIDEVKSFYLYLAECKYIEQAGGWYKLDKIVEEMNNYFPGLIDLQRLQGLLKNYRENDLIELLRNDKSLYYFLQVYLIERISDIYPANSLNTNAYRQSLINDSDYFIDKNVPTRIVSQDQMLDLSDKAVDEEDEEEE